MPALVGLLVITLAIELGLALGGGPVGLGLAPIGATPGASTAASGGGIASGLPGAGSATPGTDAVEVGQEASGPPQDPDVPAEVVSVPAAPPPLGGTELYGYLPYWEMNQEMVGRLADLPVTTVGLFSVTAAPDGTLDTTQLGYRRITGELGRSLVSAARAGGAGVDLVFTSFGLSNNHRFFGRPDLADHPDVVRPGGRAMGSAPTSPPWMTTVPALVGLVRELGLDGINVDVELLDGDDFDGYTSFLVELGRQLREARPRAVLTVASTASHHGALQARAATIAGADRIFLMAYDYHWTGSQPGGSAPLDRRDGISDIPWSIGQYASHGVPPERTLLGLPLYGMSWPVSGPGRGAVSIGKGAAWIPANHLDELDAVGFSPSRDPLQLSEFFVTRGEDGTWQSTYFDSPDTLRPKLALARDRGFAGAGFWALGYEAGLPEYAELMREFRNGEIGREQLYSMERPFGQ
jgi:hypothetical protein